MNRYRQTGTALIPVILWFVLLTYLDTPGNVTLFPVGTHTQVSLWEKPALHLLMIGLSAIVVIAGITAVKKSGSGLAGTLPLYLLPLTYAGVFLRPWVPMGIGTNLWWYGSAVLIGWALANAHARLPDRPLVWTRHHALRLVVFATLLFTATGIYFSQTIGYHSGDEAHYVTQAYSLAEDGDLDIQNNIEDVDPGRKLYYHISVNSRNDAWYSWHPFGLSVLLAPFLWIGLYPAHVVVALFSALALAGLFTACRRWGVTGRTAWLLILLWAGSLFWGGYSSRFLPEIPGAALCIWGMIALTLRREQPRASMALLLICAGIMPWMQTRFLPLSLLMVGLYGLSDLIDAATKRTWAPFVHASLTGIGAIAVYGIYYLVQNRMFVHASPYPSGSLLMNYPLGLWHSLVSERSPVYSVALFAALLPAAILSLTRPHPARTWAFQALLCFTAVWLTSCGTHWYVGGAAIPGRYLMVISVLLIPPAALWLDRQDRGALAWTFSLGALSMLLWLLVLFNLNAYDKTFTMPVATTPIVSYWLSGMNNFLLSPYETGDHYFGLALYLVSAGVLIFRSPWLRTIAFAGLVAAALMVKGPAGEPGPDPTRAARLLGESRDGRGWMFIHGEIDPSKQVSLFDIANRFHHVPPERLLRVTTRPPVETEEPPMLSQSTIEINDWAGRNLAWATLMPPFKEQPGRKVLRVRGRVEGTAQPILVVRKGSQPAALEETVSLDPRGHFDLTRTVDVAGGGDLYLLTRLEGEGTLIIEDLQWTTYPRRLMEKLSLTIPGP
ncbi:MAG: hypothetical protein KDL31_11495 [Kiritimatiellae bacterium]|nr:hypothetical protein [Kiritimatiellia bacterium]